MLVHELIEILKDQPSDAEVEMAIIAPVEESSEDITVDRYYVDGVLPWNAVDEIDDADDSDAGDDDAVSIWLVGGEELDVNAFLDALEQARADEPIEE